MAEVISEIGLALEAFKARQQDINGLGQRAFKDLFAAANTAMLTAVVQKILRTSYSEMVTANPPRTTLLAAVSQHHTEVMAGCRVLTEDDSVLRALTDAANAATIEAFQLIYAEPAKTAVRSRAPKKVVKTGSTTTKRAPKKPRGVQQTKEISGQQD
ncbi:MAG: hypothetical protein C5B58_00475 [Acidobacteria bacterium]|nr:MAG: hypothetical protein C5B58_00475 [Acidobacteriota bacterium]